MPGVRLAYHELGIEDCAYVYSTTVSRLAEHLCALGDCAPRPRSSEPVVTFDDGCVSQYHCALPVLARHEEKAIFFVTASWTDVRPEYMTSRQLREVASLGHQIQSHGWSHKFLTHCNRKELAEELRRSREVLEQLLGSMIDAISMPGGRWDRRVLAACAAAGYRRVYTSESWRSGGECEGVERIGRFMVQRRTGAGTVVQAVLGTGGFPVQEKARYILKRTARTLMGDGLYHSTWRWLGSKSAQPNTVEEK